MTPSPEKPTYIADGDRLGTGGELHQHVENGQRMTTAQGMPISDGQNSLRVGQRGPVLMEDHHLREKIFHFDHERIPERVVHARGYGVHGYLETLEAIPELTSAALFQKKGTRTEAFVRFSTVVGNKGSFDIPRDVRGFAVKLYTTEGNWDLVCNNFPVFFVQDAAKFPDFVHAAKEEQDRGFPQAASAHDTFWDFVSLVPESMHTVMWLMSDRAIPRSYRFMEGFGVHTFKLVNAQGKVSFVKFHWKPLQGLQSVLWNEAQKINGTDPDFHRRDMFESINNGDFPQWDLGIQVFDEDFARDFEFDVLDPTKIIPEEQVPVRTIARLTLDRTVTNVFSETEQVAFLTQNIVPGVEFSDDPLLQGRNFSYLDTQLSRLGSTNFTQLPVNAPRCPVAHFQRDGAMNMSLQEGRVNYEPNSLSGADRGPRADAASGFATVPDHVEGAKLRVRPESFADHFSQTRQFYISQTPEEQQHIVDAYAFELAKCEVVRIRTAVLAQLRNIGDDLAQRVADKLGMELPEPAPAAMPTRDDLAPSPALSIIENGPETFAGRKLGVLVTAQTDTKLLAQLTEAFEKVGATVQLVGDKAGLQVGGLVVDHEVGGAPSVFFDAVALLPGAGAASLLDRVPAVDFASDAFGHKKFIAHDAEAAGLLAKAGVEDDEGVVGLGADAARTAEAFAQQCAKLRFWDRVVMVS